MRKLTALFGSCMFFFIVMSLYLILDQFNGALESKDTFMEETKAAAKSVKDMKEKVARLETRFSVSDRIMDSMNKKVDDVPGIPGLPKVDVADESPVKKEEAKKPQVVVEEETVNESEDEMCMFTSSPSGDKQDIRMLDVFDKLPFDNIDGGVWKQGWDITYERNAFDEKKLLVFVCPHSHNDPGWLKTVDRYFSDQTNHIINNIVDALVKDSKRRFIWAETSYFQMWWSMASLERKQMAQQQIRTGQLEIVTGGWVMNDEANPHYFNMLDQLVEGHQWLENHIGVKPAYGWAIDPFGYTPTMAYLLKRMEFKGMLIQRVHYNVKKHFAKQKQLEFMWRQNWDHGDSTDIFTHVMPFYSYDVPHTCGPDPKVCCQFDFKRLSGGGMFCPWHIPPREITDRNIEERSKTLLDQYRKKAQLYRSNVVFAPLGDDFRWDKQFEVKNQFANYDKIMEYVNSHPELKAEIKYGTLKDFFEAVSKREGVAPGERPPTFPSLGGDFFTYADRDDHYWSGYYTSRAFFKHMDREVAAYLRGAEIIYSLALGESKQAGKLPDESLFPSKQAGKFPDESLFPKLLKGRKQLALFQHHDGITGTAKDHVVQDYGRRLLETVQTAMKVMETSASYLMAKDKKHDFTDDEAGGLPLFMFGESHEQFDSPGRRRLIVIADTPTYVVVYNSLAQQRKATVAFHISEPYVAVFGSDGHIIPHQVNLVWKSSTEIAQNKYEVAFSASIPPLGMARYSFKRASMETATGLSKTSTYNLRLQSPVREGFKVKDGSDKLIVVKNEYLSATFESDTGMLSDLAVNGGEARKMNIRFMQYGTVHAMDRSGAYLFLPSGQARSIDVRNPPVTVTTGPLFTDIVARLQYVVHRVRVYHTENIEAKSLDIQNTVDIRLTSNFEFVMRIESDLKNKDREFFTDLNGFQMQRRKTLQKLPLQANFYPVPALAFLQDSKSRMSLATQQTNGAASLETGFLEVVLDRRLMQDDNRGLGQGVTDNKITPSNFKLLLENFESGAKRLPESVPTAYPSSLTLSSLHELQHPVFPLHITNGKKIEELKAVVPGLSKPLPCDLHVVNFKTLEDNIKQLPSDVSALYLHRIGYDCGFKGKCPPQKLTFENLFGVAQVESVESTSLSLMYSKKQLAPGSRVHVAPMEIQAFKVKFK